jgi:hypothetical protein
MSADLKIPVTDTGPGRRAAAVTPSDTVSYDGPARALYVGGVGNVVVVLTDNSTVTLTNVQAGTIIPLWHKRVNSTSTTATSMVALF